MQKKISFILLGMVFIFITTVFALPAPLYLTVPHWKSCVDHINKNHAKFICLPINKPKSCPNQSWLKLNQDHLIEPCETARVK